MAMGNLAAQLSSFLSCIRLNNLETVPSKLKNVSINIVLLVGGTVISDAEVILVTIITATPLIHLEFEVSRSFGKR